MSEEEKEAVENLKEEIQQEKFDNCGFTSWFEIEKAEILLNLISNLQTELNKKDKQIDLMAEKLTTPIHSKEWVIKYFEDEIKK